MKYIRTKDERIIEVAILKEEYERDYKNSNISYEEWFDCFCFGLDIVKKADTIEELCDEFVIYNPNNDDYYSPRNFVYRNRKETLFEKGMIEYQQEHNIKVYGAIWVKGEHDESILKSVAKMKGVLPNGEIDWELL